MVRLRRIRTTSAPETISVGLQDGGNERLAAREDLGVDQRAGVAELVLLRLEGDQHPVDARHDVLKDLDDGHQALLQGEGQVDGGQPVEVVTASEDAASGRKDEVFLALEDPEEGALGDAGRAGKLPSCDREALVEDHRHDRLQNRGTALLRRQGTGTRRHTENCK